MRVSRAITNTRPLDETASKQGSAAIILQYEEILRGIEGDAQLNRFWSKYRDEFSYAKGIEFSDVCAAVRELCRESQSVSK